VLGREETNKKEVSLPSRGSWRDRRHLRNRVHWGLRRRSWRRWRCSLNVLSLKKRERVGGDREWDLVGAAVVKSIRRVGMGPGHRLGPLPLAIWPFELGFKTHDGLFKIDFAFMWFLAVACEEQCDSRLSARGPKGIEHGVSLRLERAFVSSVLYCFRYCRQNRWRRAS